MITHRRDDHRLRAALCAGGVLAAAALLSGCTGSAAAEEAQEPYELSTTDDGEGTRIHLEHDAVEQLGISTTVLAAGAVRGLQILPYAALLYGPDGATYVYTSPADDTFDRFPVTVHHVEGSTVYLSEGPAEGTPVVTQGGAELTGMEFGLEDE